MSSPTITVFSISNLLFTDDLILIFYTDPSIDIPAFLGKNFICRRPKFGQTYPQCFAHHQTQLADTRPADKAVIIPSSRIHLLVRR